MTKIIYVYNEDTTKFKKSVNDQQMGRLRRFFKKRGLKTNHKFIANYGREYYGLKHHDNKKVCYALYNELFGKCSEQTSRAEKMPRGKVLSKGFYSTREWINLRFKALEKYGNKCMCCGASPANGAVMHVDHIKPRSKYPELALDISNMQILCSDCNIGKSNKYETDFRNRK